jgi:hypothetical protein
MVEGVPEEVDVAALESGLGEDLADGAPEAGVVVGDDELDAAEPAPAQAEEEVLPTRAAFAIDISTARIGAGRPSRCRWR